MKKQKPLGMRIGESTFCIGYLVFAFIAGSLFLKRGDRITALMTFLLAGGDAFHLIPRILINIKGEGERDSFYLGLGNLISSITMTVFYVILPEVMRSRYPDVALSSIVRTDLIILCIIRVVLCLFPQNKWFTREDNGYWGIFRNIPFVIMGIITVIYLIAGYKQFLMAILVIISFVCYMLVVLFAARKPMYGMFMIPKTVCYIWMITLLLR